MAIHCPRYRLLFIGNKRTASTAVATALVEQFGGEWVPPKRVRIRDDLVISKRHATVRQLQEHGLLDAPMESLLKITAVRNPFDSLVSRWTKLLHRPNRWSTQKVKEEGIDFRTWLIDTYRDAEPQSMHDEFTEGVDVVMRFETLADDLRSALTRAGAPEIEIPVVNATEEREGSYRDCYDEETRAIVERVFAGDLAKYGYGF